MTCCNAKCSAVIAAVGVVVLVTGVVLIHGFTSIIHTEVKEQIPLKPGSMSYTNWVAPPVPIYFQVWMFDVVNPYEILAGGKPALIQKGPYTYREKRQKKDIVFNNADGTVRYRETRTFFFERSMSVGPEEDTFRGVNLIMLTIFHFMENEYGFLKSIVDEALKLYKETLFKTLSVKDLMWGYEDPFLAEVHRLAKIAHLKVPIPAKFGLFYNQNGSDDGQYNIYSGQHSMDNFGQILSWNNETKLTTWTSATANKINGSDGTIYPPFIDVSKTKYLFSSDLCRSLGMDHTVGVKKRGISLERFVAPTILFGNVTENPYNAGFCTPAGHCLPSGLLNVSACRQGAPIVMSMPNFLGCDPEVINSVDGLHPNEEEHQSYLDIEPMTGVVMNAGKRLQINAILKKIDGFPETKNRKKSLFLPVMWLNESALIDQSDADKFKTEVLDKIKMTDGIKFSLIAVGAFLIVVALSLFIKHTVKKNSQKSEEEKRLLNGHAQDTSYVQNSNGNDVNA